MKPKEKIILTGPLNWKEFRKKIIQELNECKIESEFLRLIKALAFATSTSEEEMQKKRRMLRIPET